MDFEGIGTLVLLWVFWTVFERIKAAVDKRNKQPVPYPAEGEIPGDMEFEPEFQPVIVDIARKGTGKRIPVAVKKKIPVPVVSPVTPGTSACGLRRVQLRKAVIWSEILAPPLALRKENNFRQ